MTRNEDSGDGKKNTLAARAISNEPGRRRFMAEAGILQIPPSATAGCLLRLNSFNGSE